MATVDSLARLLGDDFQKFCSVLLSRHIDEFQAVDGSGGDQGNDGCFVSGTTLFQAYAPPKGTAAKLKKKIDDSVKKAVALRKKAFPKLGTLVFLTHVELTHDMILYLQKAATKAGLIAESWGEPKLLAVLAQHPEVRSEFPEFLLPDILDAVKKGVAGKRSGEDPGVVKRALAEEVSIAVTDLVHALHPWRGHTMAYEKLAPRLDMFVTLTVKAMPRVKLYLSSAVYELLEEILLQLRKLHASKVNWEMFRENNVGGAYATDMKKQWELATEHWPTEIEKTSEKLHAELKAIVQDSFGQAGEEDRYRKFIVHMRKALLSNPTGLSMANDDPDADLALRAQAQGDLDVMVFATSLTLRAPGTIDKHA